MSPILQLLVLCFTLLQLDHTATAVISIYPVYTYCPNPTYADPVPYAFQSNLQKLLSDLSSAANSSTNTGFSSATAGDATSYPLFGIFLCRGDVPSTNCAACVDRAASDLSRSCSPPIQDAMIWYNLCMIKYSNTSFAGKLDDTSLDNAFRRIKTVDGNLTAFDTVLGGVASKVEEVASNGDGKKRFATGEGIVNQSLTVYVLGQCTPDLSAMDCRHCLGECINIMRTYCENRRGGLVLYASCNLRYETYQFYYDSDGREHSADSGNQSSGGNESLGNQYDMENLKKGVLPNGEEQSEQLLIDCGVLVTTILLFGVFVLGSLRRRVYGSSPGGCILVFHSLIAILIPFLLGLMRSAHPHKSFTIWACYLLFAYGGFDTMTARNLSDNDNSTSYFLYTFSLLFGIVYVTFEANKNINTEISVINSVLYIILVCLSAWNVIDTMGAFRTASKSKGLPEACKQTEYHMGHDFIDNNDGNSIANEEEATDDDAISMRGYSYLVVGNEKSNGATTTEVWQCLDKLFKSPTDNGEEYTRGHMQLNHSIKANNKVGERLKDICLSHALFNILLMRCAGHTLQERSRNKSRRFVEDGLLSIGDSQKMDFKRVFTIVEWELEFLFDFFYTKFYYHSTKRSPFKFRRLGILAIFMWFAIYELHQREIREEVIGPSIIQYNGHSVQVGIARTAIILIAIVEVVQLCMLIFSNWTIVKFICLYARRSLGARNTFFIKVNILFFSFFKYYISTGIDKCRLSSCMFNPWRRKLGQYSLLENYNKVPMLHRMLLCYAPRVSQKESHAITLSSKVKRAIGSLLADHGFTLSCGKTSLARNGLANELSSFCSTEPEGDAYVILVWHMATSVCEHHFSSKLGASSKQKDDEDFIVATQLSKYCAYLVIFAPELLSGVPYKTHTTVLDTIKRVHEVLKETKGIAGRCSKLVEMSSLGTQDNTIFGRVTVLVNHLRDLFLGDPKRGWKVLAEFWVELILYLAPTENAIAHAEHLANGGEFITLLWALLTNAGITCRSHFPTTVYV